MKRRLERLEPHAEGHWRAAWTAWEALMTLHITTAVLERAADDLEDLEHLTDTELEQLYNKRSTTPVPPEWAAFLKEWSLTDLRAWSELLPLIPTADGPLKLDLWPHHLPAPPAEPAGAWEALHDLLPGEQGVLAACGLFIMGRARVAREVTK